jgi:hypothetical protein
MAYWPEGQPVADVMVKQGLPVRFRWQGRLHQVKAIARTWRVDTGWWRKRQRRDYYKLLTTTGLLIILAHDLIADEWRVSRLYD